MRMIEKNNLLKETEDFLDEHGLRWNDVEFIMVRRGYLSIEDFKRLADREYDPGYGSIEVRPDLVIVGSDWWMTRGEYDGSEWWNFHRKPKKPEKEVSEADKWVL